MSLYLPISATGSVAIAVCGRCNTKIQYDELVQDPNNKLWVCKECCDILDPYRLPARRTENISLQHPRPDDVIEPGAH